VVANAPRLAHAVHRLVAEHSVITELVDQLASRARNTSTSNDVAELRRGGTALLGRLVKHRQRGADLVFEAYQTDIGGET
jgi:hypothetical protein